MSYTCVDFQHVFVAGKREATWEGVKSLGERWVFAPVFENEGTERERDGLQALAFPAEGKWAEAGAQGSRLEGRV